MQVVPVRPRLLALTWHLCVHPVSPSLGEGPAFFGSWLNGSPRRLAEACGGGRSCCPTPADDGFSFSGSLAAPRGLVAAGSGLHRSDTNNTTSARSRGSPEPSTRSPSSTTRRSAGVRRVDGYRAPVPVARRRGRSPLPSEPLGRPSGAWSSGTIPGVARAGRRVLFRRDSPYTMAQRKRCAVARRRAMSVTVRRYVKYVDHASGCTRLRTCGCPRIHAGWEYYVKVRFASGQVVTERRRVPLDNCTRAKAERYAEEREAELYRAGPAAKEAKKVVPTFREFGPRYLEEYCRANRQKPGTIIQKENNLRTHLYPRLGEKRLPTRSVTPTCRSSRAATRRPQPENREQYPRPPEHPAQVGGRVEGHRPDASRSGCSRSRTARSRSTSRTSTSSSSAPRARSIPASSSWCCSAGTPARLGEIIALEQTDQTSSGASSTSAARSGGAPDAPEERTRWTWGDRI